MSGIEVTGNIRMGRSEVVFRVSGVVVIDVTVDEDGNVADIWSSSGNIFLRQSAIDAVKQWKYSPTLMNGKPVPVRSEVRVNFALN